MARGREQGSISGDLWVPDPVNPRLNRRELLQAGAGLALGAGLAGCGIQRGLSGDTERAIEPTIDGDLVYFNYSQYIDPDLVKAFQEKYDVRVSETYFDSMPAMMAKLQGGNAYDVMFPTAEFVEKLVKSQQLIRLPIEKLENYPNIYSYFNDPWYDPGSEHSVPYSMYLTGMGYRADLVDTMTGSWNDFENEQASGRIYVLDDFQEAIGAANLRNGYDLNTVVEEELQASRDWLVSLKSNLRGFSVDTITNMSSGNAWIQHLWNGDVINIRYRVENPDDFQFQRSKEGYPVGSDCFVIPVNAEHPGTALLFMDFMLDPKNASQNCQWTGYPMPNKGADTAFAEIAKGDPNIEVTPEDIQTGHEFANLEEQDRILWDQTWVEVKAG
jgi:spermidine/putrescine transport system substrate-binding protein